MGYRSDIGCIVSSDDKEVFYNCCVLLEDYVAKAKAKVKGYEYFDELVNIDDSKCFINNHKDAMSFSIRDVKWYDSYTDVQCFNRFLDDCEEFGASFSFIRVGEDYDDVEERCVGDPLYYVNLLRGIDFDSIT